jgi:hypothetical protein
MTFGHTALADVLDTCRVVGALLMGKTNGG